MKHLPPYLEGRNINQDFLQASSCVFVYLHRGFTAVTTSANGIRTPQCWLCAEVSKDAGGLLQPDRNHSRAGWCSGSHHQRKDSGFQPVFPLPGIIHLEQIVLLVHIVTHVLILFVYQSSAVHLQISPEYIQSVYVQLFSSQMRQSTDFTRPGTVSIFLFSPHPLQQIH